MGLGAGRQTCCVFYSWAGVWNAKVVHVYSCAGFWNAKVAFFYSWAGDWKANMHPVAPEFGSVNLDVVPHQGTKHMFVSKPFMSSSNETT